MAELPVDHFEAARKRARDNGAGAPLFRRMAALQAALEARGVKLDDPRIADYMAALVPPESRRETGPVTDATKQPNKPGTGFTDPVLPPTESLPNRMFRLIGYWLRLGRRHAKYVRDNWRVLLRKYWRIPALVTLLTALAVAAWIWWSKRQPNGPTPDGGTGESTPAAETPGKPPPTTIEQHTNWDLFLGLAAFWITVVALWLLFRWWRRQVLERESNPDMGPIISLSVRFGQSNLFTGSEAERAWRQLRLRRKVTSSRVDISASLKATLAQAGYPAIRYDTRRVRPEYLIFSEREMPNDHLPEVGRALQQQMAKMQIDAVHYEFQGAPHRLRLDDSVSKANSDRGFQPIGSVLARHEGARVLVSMESFDATHGGRGAPGWLDKLSDLQRPFLLNPRARQFWGAEEQLLADHALRSISATTGGLSVYARHISSDEDIATAPLGGTGKPDLPAFFSAEREWLVAAKPLEARQHEPVIGNLEHWLTPDELAWLRTLALFPIIHRAFTHFAAMAMFGRERISGISFLKIARLPWFRVGFMPQWLRVPLTQGMRPEELETAKRVIQAFFAKETSACNDAQDIFQLQLAQKAPRKQRQFRERMAQSNLPVLSDNLLRSAFETRDPAELSLDPIVATPPPFGRRPELYLAGILLVSLAAIPLVGPYMEVTVSVATPARGPMPSPIDVQTPDQTAQQTAPAGPFTQTTTTISDDAKAAALDLLKGSTCNLDWGDGTTQPLFRKAGSNVIADGLPAGSQVTVADIKFVNGNRYFQVASKGIVLGWIGAEYVSCGKAVDDKKAAANKVPDNWHLGSECTLGTQGRGDTLLSTKPGDSDLLGGVITGGSRVYVFGYQYVDTVLYFKVGWNETGWIEASLVSDCRERGIGPGLRPPPICNTGPYIVYFDEDSYNVIRPDAIDVLDTAAANYLSACKGALVMVGGHTDNDGTRDYKVVLSQRLAEAAKNYLVGKGIPPSSITTMGYGKERPRVRTADGVLNQQNRRAEITFGPASDTAN